MLHRFEERFYRSNCIDRAGLQIRVAAGWQVFLVETNACVNGNPVSNRPSVLGEEPMVKAGNVSASPKIRDDDRSVQSGAIGKVATAIKFLVCSGAAVIDAGLAERAVEAAVSNPKLDIGLVEGLRNIVLKTIELIAELEVVSTARSTLKPGNVLIELVCLIRIPSRVGRAVGVVEDTRRLRQLRWQGLPDCHSHLAIRLPSKERTAGGIAEVARVLEVIAEPRCGNQTGRETDVRTDVEGHIRCLVADAV